MFIHPAVGAAAGADLTEPGYLFLAIGTASMIRAHLGAVASSAPSAVVVCLADLAAAPARASRQQGHVSPRSWVDDVRRAEATRGWYAAMSAAAGAAEPGVHVGSLARATLDVPLSAVTATLRIELPAGRVSLLRVAESYHRAWASEGESEAVVLAILPVDGRGSAQELPLPRERREEASRDATADAMETVYCFATFTDAVTEPRRELSPWDTETLAQGLDPADVPTLIVPVPVADRGVEPFPVAVIEQRYLQVTCPDTVAIGAEFRVSCAVELHESPTAARLEPVAVAHDGTRVAVGVATGRGLEVVSAAWVVGTMHPGEPASGFEFTIRVTAAEPLRSRLGFVVEAAGQCIGGTSVELRISTVTTIARPMPPSPLNRQRFHDGDVLLSITREDVASGWRFRYSWHDAWYRVLSDQVIDLGRDHHQLLAELWSEVDALRRMPSTDPTAARTRLRAVGKRLWTLFIPADIRDLFAANADVIRHLLLSTDDTTVPWELLYPEGGGEERGFLAERLAVTRWPAGQQPADTLHATVTRVALPSNAPASAVREAEIVRALLARHGTSEIIRDFAQLVAAIEAGQFHILHMPCHDLFGGGNVNFGGIPFGVSLLHTANLASSPLLFVNAARSGAASGDPSALDSWIRTAITRHAGAFVGPRWQVRPETATAFARTFYEALLSDASLGAAAMRARYATRTHEGDLAWLAYAVYGHPRAEIRHVA